jgi:hypothetical protein
LTWVKNSHPDVPYNLFDFNFIRVNEAFARAHQKSTEFFAGKKFFNLQSSDVQDVLEAVLRSREPSEITAFPLLNPDQPETGWLRPTESRREVRFYWSFWPSGHLLVTLTIIV